MTSWAGVRRTAAGALLAAVLAMTLSADVFAPAAADPPTPPAPTGTAAAAKACRSGIPRDVNGDGFAELAVGEPGKRQEAGAVHLFYGSSTGMVTDAQGSALDDQYIDQKSKGVPGQREAFNRFGTTIRLGDFNGDGCADLVTATFDREISVILVYGSPRGLVTTTAQRVVLGHDTAPNTLQLAVADLDGNGVDDLAVSVDDAVLVFYGDLAGLDRDTRRRTVLTARSPGVPSTVGRLFGTGLATGDFDGDGRAELAVGVLGRYGEGAVLTFEDSGNGLVPGPVRSMRTPGVPRAPERYEAFGTVMTAGDVDADGRDDLAVGLARAYCDDRCEEKTEGSGRLADGAVLLLPGSADGLTTAGSQLWTQDSPGVVGTSRHDGFGSSLAMGRLDADQTDDLVVGAPYDSARGRAAAGSVTLLLGSRDRLTTAGAGGSRIDQETPGVTGRSQERDYFGVVLSTARVRGGEQADLVVGVPYEDVRRMDVGRILLLPPGPSGPRARGSRIWFAASPGVRGHLGRYDNFGASFS